MQVFRAEMVRLAACLGDSVAVEAFIRLGVRSGRPCFGLHNGLQVRFRHAPDASGQNGQFLGGAERAQPL